jgi:hypothetical protein
VANAARHQAIAAQAGVVEVAPTRLDLRNWYKPRSLDKRGK